MTLAVTPRVKEHEVASNPIKGNATLETPAALGMSAYEWANAKEGMEQATALAHWADGTASTVGGKLRRTARRLWASQDDRTVFRSPRWELRGDLVE